MTENEVTPVSASDENVAPESAHNPLAGKKVRVGRVVSNKMSKSIVVAIERQVAHPIYKKYYRQTKKVMAHDEDNACRIGDTVRIVESRPLSAKKRWALLEIIERGE